jgi:hypothetical protein
MIAAVCWLLFIHVFFASARAVWVPTVSLAQLLCTGLDSVVSMHIVMYNHCCYASMLIKLLCVQRASKRADGGPSNNTHPRAKKKSGTRRAHCDTKLFRKCDNCDISYRILQKGCAKRL